MAAYIMKSQTDLESIESDQVGALIKMGRFNTTDKDRDGLIKIDHDLVPPQNTLLF